MASIKSKLARGAVKTTAKHTARGTASKVTRTPVRSTTLLAVGAIVGFLAARLISHRTKDVPE
jgi:uncharacterized protein YacL